MAEKPIAHSIDEIAKLNVETARQVAFIVQSLGYGIWKWDVETNSLDWDDNMYRLYGIKREDFSGAYDAWENSLSPESKSKATAELMAAVAGEQEFNTSFQIRKVDGSVQEVRARAVLVRDPKGHLKLWGINTDRSHEVELEAGILEERAKSIHSAKLASIGQMAAGVAHEINNPLATIEMELSNLEIQGSETEGGKASMMALRRATVRIAKIAGALTKYSRTVVATPHVPLVLSKVIAESINLTQIKAKRHDVNIVFEGASKSQILGDEMEIEQVLINLINNAIDAASVLPEKWVKVTLLEAGDRLTLKVQDCGRGLPENVVQSLFQPFFTTKGVGHGTGLGLSIARTILDKHGAVISFNSQEPHTCFEIRFKKIIS